MVDIKKNGTSMIRVGYSVFKGQQRFDVREYYLNDDDEWAPTRKGVSIPNDLVPHFVEAVISESGVGAEEWEEHAEGGEA